MFTPFFGDDVNFPLETTLIFNEFMQVIYNGLNFVIFVVFVYELWFVQDRLLTYESIK